MIQFRPNDAISGVGSMYGQGGQKDRREAPKNFFYVAPPENFAGGADFHNRPILKISIMIIGIYIAPYIFYTLYVSLYG